METESSGAACLLCVQCKDAFHSPWDLMVHVQAAHMLNIYELGVPSRKESSTSPPPLQDTPPPPTAAVCPLETLTNDDMVSWLCTSRLLFLMSAQVKIYSPQKVQKYNVGENLGF